MIDFDMNATKPAQTHVTDVMFAVVGTVAARMFGTQPRSRRSGGRRRRARRGCWTRGTPRVARGRHRSVARTCAVCFNNSVAISFAVVVDARPAVVAVDTCIKAKSTKAMDFGSYVVRTLCENLRHDQIFIS